MNRIKLLLIKILLRVANLLGHEGQRSEVIAPTSDMRKLLVDAKVFRFNTPPQINLKQFFLTRNYLISRTIDEASLHNLLIKLSPVNIQEGLIRVGGPGDGGYLVPDNISDISTCFSPGVAENANFEKELNQISGAKAFLADYSVNESPIKGNDFHFTKKFLGRKNDDVFMRLEDWVRNSIDIQGESDCMLQMDIEGHEYSVLFDTPQSILTKFRILVIEFHSLDQLLGAQSFHWIESVFEHLLANFKVVHIHPNNCAPVWIMGDIEVPTVLEMTFYRKDLVVETGNPVTYPHPLDEINVPTKNDVGLASCWGVSSKPD